MTLKQTFDSPKRDRKTKHRIDARTRLLHAALELFGKHGFAATSVRDLAASAEVNVAAVNYHFGSKDCLRMEALRYGFAPTVPVVQQLHDMMVNAREMGTREAAEDALRRFVKVFLKDIVGREGKHWAMFMREGLSPGPGHEMVVREYFVPIGQVLGGIVSMLVPGADEQTGPMCISSVISQCVHVRTSAPTLRFFTGRDPRSSEYLDRAAEHIATFSIYALRGMDQAASNAKNAAPVPVRRGAGRSSQSCSA